MDTTRVPREPKKFPTRTFVVRGGERPPVLSAASANAKCLTDELREAVFQVRDDGVGNLLRVARALLGLAPGPLLDVGVGFVDAELHGGRIDEHLETLGERPCHRLGGVAGFHAGRDASPGDDAVRRHAQPPIYWPRSVMRSPGANRESSAWVTPSTASFTSTSMCSPIWSPCQSAASSSGKRRVSPRNSERTVAPCSSGSSKSRRPLPSPPTNFVTHETISTGIVVVAVVMASERSTWLTWPGASCAIRPSAPVIRPGSPVTRPPGRD